MHLALIIEGKISMFFIILRQKNTILTGIKDASGVSVIRDVTFKVSQP